ncbi:DUF2062 domain-containing protein [Flavobacterium cellulosilyticum]|uniref:DUF2062 domain-containing protein n=1 Tax=Flavobacterium cellulosilyticum TaxID=2541731 RepID=A0A4R5CBP4_9FLAO|nr:DUF2062 domain-containing protein [Flavobacterium cellulosilyticum]TDD94544.1 DUF2062 domain-containing protein [Flavobacterium cellulosilyticum]
MKLKSFIAKFTVLFKQGLSPKKLSQSIIVSGLISTIPILGVSTFIITTISLKSKLNLPVMIALSYLMWPIQILMIIPFIKVGQFIFSVPSNHHSVEEIINSFQDGFFATLSYLSFELLCGLGGWMLTAVPFAFGVYLVTLLLLKEKNVS